MPWDYDGDGDLDLLITNVDQPLELYENQSVRGGNWLAVRLVGTGTNRSAVGATVSVVTADGRLHRRDVVLGGSFLTGMPSDLHFGLGPFEVESMFVRWPDGTNQEIAVDGLNRLVTVEQLATVPGWSLPAVDD